MFPVRVGAPIEQAGHRVPALPTSRCRGNHSGRQPASDGDLDFLTGLDPSHQLGSILTQFSQSNSTHPATVAQVLSPAKGGKVGRRWGRGVAVTAAVWICVLPCRHRTRPGRKPGGSGSPQSPPAPHGSGDATLTYHVTSSNPVDVISADDARLVLDSTATLNTAIEPLVVLRRDSPLSNTKEPP